VRTFIPPTNHVLSLHYALGHYQRALRLLDTGADQQFVQWNHPSVVANVLDGLRNTVREHSRQNN